MTAEDRVAICADCEWFRKVIWQCKKCGCFVKAKARFKNETCPLKKW